MTSQAVYGRVNMNVYSAGRELLSIGVLGNMCDMLPETAFVKLSWLLSNFKKEDIKHLYGTNMRGEITERSEEEFFED
ncbi:MAG: Glu-tRNA(Gln) amidotransferase GatDE subunit D, partial [Candidatus Aenigmarchaeota archaeon]|nr:Glu-tRNA(Gln) amidotransferase GatDE subunit D [Candidatus Aenigmarchaeota archaeon]